MTKLLKISSFFLFLRLTILVSSAQQCETDNGSNITYSNFNRNINWEQFGEINLPFTLVYGGPTFNGKILESLDHGFSHLSDYNSFPFIPASQRALIYYGVAFPNQNQPWENLRSPWENDLELYEQKWKTNHSEFANGLPEKSGRIEADIMMFDIERQWRSDFDILQLKSNSNISSQYRNLSNAEFLSSYKTDLKEIYTKALASFRNLGYGTNTKVSSYSDAPIWNTFANITGYSWADWQQSKTSLNFLLQNEQGDVGGSFDQELDFMAPSAYYYYDYPHPFAGEYLSYLLFQIEANKARTSKPLIPFVWLRYSFTPEYQNQFIKPWMAEATAIFPFFSGADGLWLWENPFNFTKDENFSTYEHFLHGLKRLSTYESMFRGDFQLVIDQPARDLNEQKKPVWRGVVKDNLFLVAAHNPFAKDANEVLSIEVKYQNFIKTVQLKGYETSLCLFDLNLLGNEKEEIIRFNVFPNPTSEIVNISYTSSTTEAIKLLLHDVQGKIISKSSFVPKIGENDYVFEIKGSSFQTAILTLIQGDTQLSRKVIAE